MSSASHALPTGECALTKKERPSRVTFVIEPSQHAVKLTVTHEGFPEGSKTLPSISEGWPLVLSSLKSILETGRSLAFEKVLAT